MLRIAAISLLLFAALLFTALRLLFSAIFVLSGVRLQGAGEQVLDW